VFHKLVMVLASLSLSFYATSGHADHKKYVVNPKIVSDLQQGITCPLDIMMYSHTFTRGATIQRYSKIRVDLQIEPSTQNISGTYHEQVYAIGKSGIRLEKLNDQRRPDVSEIESAASELPYQMIDLPLSGLKTRNWERPYSKNEHFDRDIDRHFFEFENKGFDFSYLPYDDAGDIVGQSSILFKQKGIATQRQLTPDLEIALASFAFGGFTGPWLILHQSHEVYQVPGYCTLQTLDMQH
jgi:hypothetical protein